MRKSFVAMFHDIQDSVWFEDTLLFLKQRYEFVDANQILSLLKQKEFHSAKCHISFDDGNSSFHRVVLPVLLKHRIPASLFISPLVITNSEQFWFQKVSQFPQAEFMTFLSQRLADKIPQTMITSVSSRAILKTLKYSEIADLIDDFSSQKGITYDPTLNLNISQLKDVTDCGLVTVGAHTLNHPILANEDDQTAELEIRLSIAMTQELTHKPVNLFACPNGIPGLDFGTREQDIMKENGILMNFSTQSDSLTDKYGYYCIPRIGITKGSKQFIGLKLRVASLWSYIRSERDPKSELNQRKTILRAKKH